MKSARSIADQKLQKQIEEAEKKRAELLKSMEQGDAELGQLRKSLATARMASGRASGRASAGARRAPGDATKACTAGPRPHSNSKHLLMLCLEVAMKSRG